jgi:Na+/proline symporter
LQLTWLDWAVIALYFLFNIGIGLYSKARAGKNVSEFFLSGRNVPWWLAGTSMVANDIRSRHATPGNRSGRQPRHRGNWLWWNFVAGGMPTVFLYARLWRRSGVMTDIEFSATRYAGKPTAILRGFRATYLGIPVYCIILGWVDLAMVKILGATLGVSRTTSLVLVIGLIIFTSLISTLSELRDVLVTDCFQFAIKMTMIDYLPPYFRGLMLAGFAATYMSTIATQLNWGASYLVNDFYRRFMNKTASDKHYVNNSQAATVLLTILSIIVTSHMDTIASAMQFPIAVGAGTGSVLLLRWYWWHVNAWSEISAMAASFLTSVTLQGFAPRIEQALGVHPATQVE